MALYLVILLSVISVSHCQIDTTEEVAKWTGPYAEHALGQNVQDTPEIAEAKAKHFQFFNDALKALPELPPEQRYIPPRFEQNRNSYTTENYQGYRDTQDFNYEQPQGSDFDYQERKYRKLIPSENYQRNYQEPSYQESPSQENQQPYDFQQPPYEETYYENVGAAENPSEIYKDEQIQQYTDTKPKSTSRSQNSDVWRLTQEDIFRIISEYEEYKANKKAGE